MSLKNSILLEIERLADLILELRFAITRLKRMASCADIKYYKADVHVHSLPKVHLNEDGAYSASSSSSSEEEEKQQD